MVYRVLEYGQAIANQVIEQRENHIYDYPTVIAIVLYTGKQKWTAKTSIEDLEKRVKGCEDIKLRYGYRLVDIAAYSKEKLLKDNLLLTKAMAIEKCRTKEEAMQLLEEIVKNSKKDKKQIGFLVEYTLKNLLGEKQGWKLLYKEGKEFDTMLAENIREENRRIKKEGRREGRKEGREELMIEMIANMTKLKLDISMIQQVTGRDKREIMKIQKECNI